VTVDDVQVERWAAFTEDPAGGNPAGLVIRDAELPAAEMQRIAAAVGDSETAFLSRPTAALRSWQVRYFSPRAEVPFCGHATIAAGVLLGRRVGEGRFLLHTPSGEVPVEVVRRDGRLRATLTSVEPTVTAADPALLGEALAACGLGDEQLDPRFPPAIGFAGAHHLLLVLGDREALQRLTYDVGRLRAVMSAHRLTTVAILWPDPTGDWHARNLFPVGGVVEDPATGAAAAAFGAYLRSHGAVAVPSSFAIHQGAELGRPSILRVTVPPGRGGIEVAGTAVELEPHTAPAAAARQHVGSGSPYEGTYGFSRALRVGDLVHVAGTGPIWPDGSCDPDPGAQARRCLEIIVEALAEAGASIEDVVRTRMYVTDAAVADVVGRVHGEWFGSVRPAATLVVVAGLVDPRWLVEMEADAHLPSPDG
jgi:PhzF family phenazine biosynthesis protein